MSQLSHRFGNIVGSARAETDQAMLECAFVETADFRALVETIDFNFVVGRRGTGKSALFQQVTKHFGRGKGLLCLSERPEEFHALEMQANLSKSGASYSEMRAASRLAWKTHLLYWALSHLIDHYKISGSAIASDLTRYLSRAGAWLRDDTPHRANRILAAGLSSAASPREVPACIAEQFQTSKLQEDVAQALGEANRTVLLYYDGLDEGWSPGVEATAVLGGLAAAVSDLDEAATGIHGTLFIRDNMFRALAHFDQDFSRSIEGNALRLHWDESSLFELVAARLRVTLGVKTENPEKVWNAFVDEPLRGREGFEECLRLTLYRPRDILVLVNRAFVAAARRGSPLLTQAAIEAAATEISNDRLDDLVKEYDQVLPGVASFVRVFEGAPAFQTVGTVVGLLDEEIAAGAYLNEADSDFAILGSGKQVLFALYGIGFLGFVDSSRNTAVFCHDGSGASLDEFGPDRQAVVHPCYWKALELDPGEGAAEVVVEVNDEFDVSQKASLADNRVRRLGQILSELPHVELGPEGAAAFEEWVLTTVRVLFAGHLSNPELHPAPDAIQRRDVVATITADSGLWRRIREDWDTRQVVFEVKNYEDLKLDDFRQLLSYTSGQYGRFGIIVYRSKSEAVSDKQKGWLKTFYHEHQRLFLTIPAGLLARSMSKLRNADRHDYIENQLNKRLDRFVRSYLSLRHHPRYKSKTKSPKKREARRRRRGW